MSIIFDQHNAYHLLKQLAFPRSGGTPEEKTATTILKRYLISSGLKPKEETFGIQNYKEIVASLEVVRPYRKKYKVAVIGNSGSTPGKGITAELVHITSSAPEELKKARNKIALTYNPLDKTFYQRLKKHQIKAIIRVTSPVKELRHLKLNDFFIKAYGKIPSVILGYDDALEIIHKNGEIIRVVSRQKEFKATSRNIIATIQGSEIPQEKVIICAHYDSVHKSPGCIDNGSGSATIAEISRFFAKNPLKRTLIFIWFGSEELGLKGSWAYTQRHKKEFMTITSRLPRSRRGGISAGGIINTPQIKLVINFDVTGTIFGNNGVVICGSQSMANFVESFSKERGLPMEIRHSAYSSDNIPFNEKGIPSISLYRSSSDYGHTPLDDINLISPDGLKVIGQFGLELVNRIVNAVEIPFDLTIPESDKKFTYEYIERANPFYKKIP